MDGVTTTPDDFREAPPITRLIACVLHRGNARWPAPSCAVLERSFLDACGAHGVAALVHHRARQTTEWPHWPGAVREALSREAAMHAALDMLREQELRRVLAALAEARLDTLLLKGAALAYSHYPSSALRSRCDTDLLVSPSARAPATRVLEALGYRPVEAIGGTLVSYQESFHRVAGGVDHVVDLHWRVSNAQLFATALGFDAAFARSVPLPQLGAGARALCPSHALLHACMHRAAHLPAGGDGNRLVWLYDIHLLASAMSAAQWREFVALCMATKMRGIALDAFAAVHAIFGAAVPAAVAMELAAPCARELSADYLDAPRWRILLTDLRALAAWRDRAKLLRETCFPSAHYLRARYGARSRWALPWWYGRRALGGLWKLAGLAPIRGEAQLDARRR